MWMDAFRTSFVAEAPAVSAARRFLDPLAGVVSPDCLEDARLMVSELVTNSIQHGHLPHGARVSLRVRPVSSGIRVEVEDSGRGFDADPRSYHPGRHGGWGLFLVDRLARAWGVSDDGAVTGVWFEVPSDAR